MTSNPDTWVYGDFAPDPARRDLPGLKARWLIEQLPPAADPVVLDYGAGEGKHLHLIRTVRPQARLVGVDIRAAHSAVDFEFHQVAANARLPFADATYDIVISCDVLEHVADINQSLEEISRVLRRGGSFVGFVPAEGGPGPHALFRFRTSIVIPRIMGTRTPAANCWSCFPADSASCGLPTVIT
jgi:ubiquinone/menaquinone biosynthesis C-methylase UbiE